MPRKPSEAWVKHTVVIGPSTTGFKWKCKYCGGDFNSTITRVICHVSGVGGKGIGGCKSVPKNIADEVRMQNQSMFRDYPNPTEEVMMEDELEEISESVGGASGGGGASNTSISMLKRSRINSNVDPPPSSSENPSNSCGNAKRSSQYTLARSVGSLSWLKERQRLANIEIGRTVIECNLSFNVLQTAQWKRMIKAVSNVGACENWGGVSYKEMRTSVLNEEMGRIQKALDPIKEGWSKFGCSILSNGWSDIRRRSIINILVSSCLGTDFLRAVDAGKGGQRITGEFIFHHICQAILDVGTKNVVQVVTDNASNCRRMGDLVEQEFPSIVWTPCASHCLDLLMEDIGKLPWIANVILEANAIVSFFTKKTKALAIFREYSQLEILRPSMTRFAYMFVVLDHLLAIHNELRRTVVSSEWVEWSDSTLSESIRVQRACLDPTFWMDVQAIATALKPLCIVLRVTDMEGSTLGLLHHFMGKIFTELDNCTSLSADRSQEVYHKALAMHLPGYKEEPYNDIKIEVDAMSRLRGYPGQLQRGQCSQVHAMDIVLAARQVAPGNLQYFEARILKAQRQMHSANVSCECNFEVCWLDSAMRGKTENVTASGIRFLSKESLHGHPAVSEWLSSDIENVVDIQAQVDEEIERIAFVADDFLEKKNSIDGGNVDKGSTIATRSNRRKDGVTSSSSQRELSGKDTGIVDLPSSKRQRLSPLAARAALAASSQKLLKVNTTKSPVIATDKGSVGQKAQQERQPKTKTSDQPKTKTSDPIKRTNEEISIRFSPRLRNRNKNTANLLPSDDDDHIAKKKTNPEFVGTKKAQAGGKDGRKSSNRK